MVIILCSEGFVHTAHSAEGMVASLSATANLTYCLSSATATAVTHNKTGCSVNKWNINTLGCTFGNNYFKANL